MKKHRIPLPSHLATRDPTLSHDGNLQNFYEEDTPIGKMVVKRPGQTNNVALGPCLAQGSTFFNNNSYFICSNVIYVNPTPTTTPSCPAPGSAISWGSGFFAMLDPVTNFVWTSDAQNTVVNVYDPTDQSLKASITNPAGSLGGPAGLFYLSTIRSFVTSSGNALSNPDVWIIDAGTYAITHTVDFAGGSGYAPFFPSQIPFTNIVVDYSNNNFGGAGNFSFVIGTYTGSAANPYPVFVSPPNAPKDYLPIPNMQLVSYYNGNNIWIVNFASPATFTTYTTAGSTDVSQQTYDTIRKRIWYVDVTSNALTYIDLSAGVAGSQVIVSTLAQTIKQIVYDPQRDVLWCAASGSGDILKVSPSTGAVLKTYPGVGTGASAPLNVGTRLVLWKSCSLIQNTGGLRLIPIQ
jgi:hypothetical protein